MLKSARATAACGAARGIVHYQANGPVRLPWWL